MRIREKIEREQGLDERKILLLDTSSILSDHEALEYPNHKVITSGVLGELYKLSFYNTVARERYNKVSRMLDEGKMYLMKSDVSQELPDLDLSPIDSNLIRVAQYFSNGVLVSCDRNLCQVARSKGIHTYSVRTNLS